VSSVDNQPGRFIAAKRFRQTWFSVSILPKQKEKSPPDLGVRIAPIDVHKLSANPLRDLWVSRGFYWMGDSNYLPLTTASGHQTLSLESRSFLTADSLSKVSVTFAPILRFVQPVTSKPVELLTRNLQHPLSLSPTLVLTVSASLVTAAISRCLALKKKALPLYHLSLGMKIYSPRLCRSVHSCAMPYTACLRKALVLHIYSHTWMRVNLITPSSRNPSVSPQSR
jgi:hypothetical protein